MSITAPGIYEMPAEDYHADPAPEPSLSAGMINDLLTAPRLCFDKSSRLNPDYEEPEAEDKFSIGTVAHLIFLEPALFDARVEVCDYKDWRTNDAKAQRDAARDEGRTPILAKNLATVHAARAEFMANPFTAAAFERGTFEQSMFWRHPVHGFWCRARPDFMAESGTHLNDYKATACADPAKFDRHAFNMGYHRRAAWYLEGAAILLGKRPQHYWFCNQETKRPYLTSVVELDRQALDAGQQENDTAAARFAYCLRTGDWYGYRHPQDPTRDRAFTVGLPAYAYMQIDART